MCIEKEGGQQEGTIVSIEYGTLASVAGFVFNFAVVFLFDVFPFPPSTDKFLGDWQIHR